MTPEPRYYILREHYSHTGQYGAVDGYLVIKDAQRVARLAIEAHALDRRMFPRNMIGHNHVFNMHIIKAEPFLTLNEENPDGFQYQP